MLATVVDPLATGLLYLAIAVPLAVVAALFSRKPLLPSAIVSAVVLVAVAVSRYQLPFHFWAHANDFIIEPLIRDRVIGDPIGASLSLAFHIGLPTFVGREWRWWSDRRKRATRGFDVLPEAKRPET
jgi:hypothetical protein